MKREDSVEHPDHYGGAENPYEAIKVITAWKLNFALGNAIKYICRCRAPYKGAAITDLKKARFYLDQEIKQRELENIAAGKYISPFSTDQTPRKEIPEV